MEQMRLDFDAAEKTSAAPAIKDEATGDTPNNQGERTSTKPKILSVSDVNKAVKSTLESDFKLIWLKGEISNFKPHTSGHWYFSLKDSKAQISAVMFKGFNQGLRFKPRDGMEVIVRGKITVYEPRGSYQIFCELIDPVGAGALQMAFEQLKKKLELEGLFAKEKKRPLPVLPKHVAVVTSPTGAAIRDILNVLNRRFKGLRVTVVPALVQGEAAAPSIVQGILNAQKLPDVDVMIVGRGGGSIEDMWCFNDERVARTIAASRVPVISAVGHEIDFTIADFVADLRAPTPSAAAELVCRNAAELSETINVQKKRLWRALQAQMSLRKQHVFNFSKRLVDPKRRLQDLSMRCDELEQRLQQGMARYLDLRRKQVQLAFSRVPSPKQVLLRLEQNVKNWRARLESALRRGMDQRAAQWARQSSLLDAVSPLKVVERGYSITSKDGRVVKSAEQLTPGDRVQIRFAKGSATANVEQVIKD